uniref:Xyloglucan endotransglucosylase/hydrolase n=1 Tax=Salix viminalis TaxID=40686 RepID=A0A6N2LG86_SALVM
MFSTLSFLAFLLIGGVLARRNGDASFDRNYDITWGNDHVLSIDEGRQIQLSLDNSSAMMIMFKDLTSHSNNHDELDFEFLGNREGKPITLQTNVFADGQGNREQRMYLWFDPAADFHSYKILWNQYQIVLDGKTNWSHAPFQTHFQGFDVNGCPVQDSDIQPCYSTNYWWNTRKYWTLDSTQQRAYENVRKKYLTYDYCSDRPRYPTPPPECPQ